MIGKFEFRPTASPGVEQQTNKKSSLLVTSPVELYCSKYTEKNAGQLLQKEKRFSLRPTAAQQVFPNFFFYKKQKTWTLQLHRLKALRQRVRYCRIHAG